MACMHGSPIGETCPYCANTAKPQPEDALARDLSVPFIEYGWACPKCGGVYAPHVRQCGSCTPRTLP